MLLPLRPRSAKPRSTSTGPVKNALLLEVIETVSERLPDFNSGDAKTDLRNLLRHLAQAKKKDELGRIWPRVIGYAAANPDFARGMQISVFEPRRREISRILDRGIKAGQLTKRIDADRAVDLLVGPIMHRRFVSMDQIPPAMPDEVVDYFWKIFGKNGSRSV